MDEEFEAFFGPQNIKKGLVSEKEFQELIDRNESQLFEQIGYSNLPEVKEAQIKPEISVPNY